MYLYLYLYWEAYVIHARIYIAAEAKADSYTYWRTLMQTIQRLFLRTVDDNNWKWRGEWTSRTVDLCIQSVNDRIEMVGAFRDTSFQIVLCTLYRLSSSTPRYKQSFTINAINYIIWWNDEDILSSFVFIEILLRIFFSRSALAVSICLWMFELSG